jgi:nucleotide-binding universal stress UspA family protein
LASGTDSALHVVHVVSTVPELPYPRASARERSEALLERKRLGGLKLLDDRLRWMEELLVGSIAASHYREGRPEKEVVRLGKELDAGLILSGGRWRPWFERIFGAGFSENLSRRADRPVLAVSELGLRRSTAPR